MLNGRGLADQLTLELEETLGGPRGEILTGVSPERTQHPGQHAGVMMLGARACVREIFFYRV
jgi:hypothetical protein